jgi:hypothetical protein
MEEDESQRLGKEGEEEATTAGATRQERCLEVPKNHHSRFVYTNPACLLTAKGASVDDAPHIAFVSRLSCINNNVRRPLLVVTTCNRTSSHHLRGCAAIKGIVLLRCSQAFACDGHPRDQQLLWY